MKKFVQLLTLAALLCVPWVMQAQTPFLSEEFNSSNPTGWTGGTTQASQVFAGTTLSTSSSPSWSYQSSAKNGIPGGRYHFNFYSSTTPCYKWMITPSIDLVSAPTAQLSFDLAITGYSSVTPSVFSSTAKFMVIVSDDNGATWDEATATIWSSSGGHYDITEVPSSYQTYTVNLNNYVGNPIKIAFYFEQTSNSGDNIIHIDNVLVEAVPACAPVSQLQAPANHLTPTSALLTWVDNSNSNVPYIVKNGDVVVGNAPAGSNQCSISGLTTNTEYTLTVYADCGGDGLSAGRGVTFRTPVVINSSNLPYTCGFESGENATNMGSYPLPWGWTRKNYSGDYPYSYSSYGHSGSYSGRFQVSYSNSNYCIGVLPKIDTNSVPINTLRLRFWARRENSYNGILKVGTMSDPTDASTFTEVKQFTISGSTYNRYTVANFPATTDQYIAIRMDGNGSTSQYAYIDDLTLDLLPDCYDVDEVTVTALTNNSVTLGWTPGPAGATYTVKNGNEVLTTTAADATSATITGLTPSTDYTLSVWTHCTSSDSDDSTTVSFRTFCAGEALPYENGFEYGSSSISCWTQVVNSGINTDPSVYSSYSNNGYYCLRFNGNNTNSTTALPYFDQEVNTTQLSFYLKAGGNYSSYGTFQVGYITNVLDPSTFVPITTLLYSDCQEYTKVVVPMASAPAGARIALKCNASSTSYYWYVDDIKVEDKQGCMMPSGLTVTNVTGNSAVLNWTDNNAGAATYRITDGTNVLVAATTAGATTYTLEGLTSQTPYNIYVMANCAGETTSDTASVSFTTECPSQALPYLEAFDGINNGDLPDCWRLYTANLTSTVSANSDDYSSGPRSLYFYNSNGNEPTNSIVALPPMNAATNTLEVQFAEYAYSYSNYNDKLQIGYLTDLDDTTSFVVVEECNRSYGGFINHRVLMTGAPANARIAFRHCGPAGYNYWRVDDLLVAPINNCLRVTNAYGQYQSSTQGYVSWTDTVSRNVTYSIYNGETLLYTTPEEGYSYAYVNGLNPNTTYLLSVVANCSDTEHSLPTPISNSFTTLSDSTEILSFDITTPDVRRGDAVFYQHTITMPIYYTTDFSNVNGSFTLSNGASLYYVDGNNVEHYVSSMNNLRQYLTQSEVMTLRVRAQDNNIYTDWSLSLEVEPCTSPRNLTLSAGRSTVDVNWDMLDTNVEDYQIVWSNTPMDNDALDAATKTNFSDTTYRIMGLDRDTLYYVYLRSVCDISNLSFSSWVSASVKTQNLGCNIVYVGDTTSTQTSSKVPVDNYYRYTLSESIIDAAELGSSAGTISGMSFYYHYSYSITDKSNVTVWLQPTTTEVFSSSTFEPVNPTTAVQVYKGDFNFSQGWNDLVFDVNFAYDGSSNLLLIVCDSSNDYNSSSYVFRVSSTQGYKTLSTSNDGSPYNPYDNLTGLTQRDLRPIMRFNVCVPSDPCPTVSDVAFPIIRYNAATVTWSPSEADYLGEYNVILSTTALDSAGLADYSGTYAYQGLETTCELNGLTELTDYYVYVRAVCNGYNHDEGTSTWYDTMFTSAAGCYAPINGQYTLTDKNAVTISWQNGDPDDEQPNNFRYLLSSTQLDATQLAAATCEATNYTDTTVNYSDLVFSAQYYFYVRNVLDTILSPWLEIPFQTYDTLPAVINLAVTDTQSYWLTAEWQINTPQFANETAWQVAIVPTGDTPAQWTIVEDTTHFFYGLTAATTYDLYVRPYDQANTKPGTETYVTVTTRPAPDPCYIVAEGNGTTTTEFAPVYGYWTDNAQRVQSIYPAEMLEPLLGKTINSLHYFVQSGTNSNFNHSTFVVRLGITDLDNLSNGFDNDAPLTDYYTGYINANPTDGMTITLDEPFTYNGGNLLVEFEEPTASGWNHVYFFAESRTGASRYARTGETNSNLVHYLPTLQFCYERDTNCFDMMDVTVSNVTTNSADVAWMPGGSEMQWQYLLGEDVPTDSAAREAQAQEINTLNTSYNTLEPDMDYYFYIRPVCDPDSNFIGPWATRHFRTVATCGRPSDLTATNIDTRTVTLNAVPHPTIGTPDSFTFRYWEKGTDVKTMVPSATSSVDIEGLTPNTDYEFDVRTHCTGDDGSSRWSVAGAFTTKLEPLSLDVDRIYTFDPSQDKDWVLVNGTGFNRWVRDTAAYKTDNGRGLYISNDGGATNAYTFTLNGTYAYAYSAFTFEQDKQYVVEFQWKNKGENNDYLRAWLVPNSYEPVADEAPGTTSAWLPLDNNANLYNVDTWNRSVNNFFNNELNGGDYKLLFMWRNDNANGNNPPAAIDSVVVRERERFTVTANVNSDAENMPLGEITGNVGTHYTQTPISLLATAPIYGYHFAGWFTGDNYTVQFRPNLAAAFTLDKNYDLLARYDSNEYTITAMVAEPPVDPLEVRGTVDPTSTTKKFNLPVTITATPAVGYHFVNWTDQHNTVCSDTTVFTVPAYRDSVFTANFDTNIYYVAVINADTVMGSITGADSVKHFLNTTLTATNNYGYHFTCWTNAAGDTISTVNPLDVFPVSDTTLTGHFYYNQYTVTGVPADAIMGNVSGTASVNYLSYVSLKATPEYGYHFVRWMEADTLFSEEDSISVQALSDRTITAVFDTNIYYVAVYSNDTVMGSVDGAGEVKHFLSGTLTATNNYGYHFTMWTNENGDTVSTVNPLEVFPVSDTALYANFDYNQYTVTGLAIDTIMGNVAGTETVNYLQYVTLTATPKYGYHFVKWVDANDDEVATTDTLTIQALKDTTVWAVFDTNVYNLVVISADTVMGTATGSAQVKHFLSREVTATNNYGYHFTEWTDENSNVVSSDNPLTVYPVSDTTLIANFDYNQYTVTGLAADTVMGNVTGTATVNYLTNVTLTATPKTGYHFVNWVNANDEEVATTETLTIQALKDTTVWAVFDTNVYNLVVTSADTVMGAAAGTAQVKHFLSSDVTATNNYGYHFVNWSDEAGNDVSTDNPLTVFPVSDTALVANFDYNQYTVTGLAADTVMGNVTGTATVNYLTNVTLTATPKTGYHFVNWVNANDEEVATTDTLTIQALKDTTVWAIFDTNVYNLVVTSADTVMGAATGTAQVKHFLSSDVTATNNYGYHFVNWSDEAGNDVSTDNPLTVYPVSDTALVANFDYNQYTVTGLSTDTVMGNTAGTATVNYLTNVTLTATAKYGYHFVNWVDANDAEVATTDTLIIQALKDTTVWATFDFNQYTVTGLSNDTVMGTVTGTATVNYLTDVTLTATPKTCYYFVQWNDGNTDNPRVVTATEDLTYTAEFGVIDYSGDTTAIVCDNFEWHGNTYTASVDTVTYTYTTAEGCDSIVTLDLTVKYSTTYTDVQTACDQFTWMDNNTYTASVDTVIFTTVNAVNCDSVITLDLTVNYSNTGVDVVIACDSTTWIDGITYTADVAPSDNVTFTVTNLAGCDSVVTLDLTLNGIQLGTDSVTACDSYTWRDGITYTASNNTATFNATNTNACDSLITLVLTMKYSSASTDVQTACDEFTWMDNNTYTASVDTVTFTTVNAVGCDSVITLDLTVNYSTTSTDVQTACDEFTWMDNNTYTASVDTVTFTTVNAVNCDSVITLDLTVNYSNTGIDEQTACDSYIWHNVTYTASNNTATFTETNVAGCDSVVTLNLTVNYSNTGVDVQTACDEFTWMDNNTYTASNNTATYTLTNQYGCDSVVTLNLTVNYSTASTDVQTACDEFTWMDNNTYTASVDTITFTTLNVMNCDSVITLDLTVNYSNTGVDVQTACDEFTWIDNITYTESPVTYAPTFTLTNIMNCDSVVTLNLTVNYSTTYTDVQLGCESYTWMDDVTYTNSVSPSDSVIYVLTNAVNCDSVIFLDLTLNSIETAIDSVTACDSFTWRDGITYNVSNNTATYTVENTDGCDSLLTLKLTILHSLSATDYVTTCDEYTWVDGITYTESNDTAIFVATKVDGCDSVLHLTLVMSHSTTSIDHQLACESFTWIDGYTYIESNNTATYTTTNAAGCDSVITLDLTISHNTQVTDVQMGCDNFTWIDGNTYTSDVSPNDNVTFTLTNAAGCDSVVVLDLTMGNTAYTVDVQTACDEYTWRDGVTYTESNNTATYTVNNTGGCDSVITLNLTINNSNTGVDVQTACDEYTWIDGITYTASNSTATFTLTNAAGCDSVVTLDLTVNYANASTDVQTACDEFTWIDGITYTESPVTYAPMVTLTNAAGCDSVVSLNLTINYSTTAVDAQTACDTYTWIDGIEYTASNNTAIYTTTNAAGCDSVITLDLTINTSNTGVDVQTACDTYTWIDGIEYTASNNTATFTLTNVAGCDSVVTLDLTINTSNTGVDVQTACNSFAWIDGYTYIESNNTATFTLTNQYGCDSVVTLNLTLNHSNSAIDVQTACDSYTWIDGVTYTESPVTYAPTYTLTNVAGCDSVVTLYLTINYNTAADDAQTACNSFTWIDGVTYTASTNTATYTLTNAAGCDSVVTLNLTILPNYTVSFNANGGNGTMNGLTVCSGQSAQLPANTFTNAGYFFQGWATVADGQVVYTDGATVTVNGDMNLYAVWEATCTDVLVSTSAVACDSYAWRNVIYQAGGIYYDTVNNAILGGCDSVYQLMLTINNSTAAVVTQRACDTYTWIDGVTYTASTNTSSYTLTNAAGCDSVVTLHLTIVNSTASIFAATACDTYTWNGVTYTASTNTPTFTTVNADGCDSVVTLHLTINNSTSSIVTATACDSYTWHGTTYTETPVTYLPTYTTTNAAGCDSVITLYLTINHSTASTVSATACDSYTWHGVNYTASTNTPTYTTTNAAGCDSVVTLNLTINHSTASIVNATACDSYTWHGTTYTASTNNASYTTTNAAGCDSVVTLHLTINNSTASVVTVAACESYTWHGTTYTVSTNLPTYTTTNAAGCDHVETLHLTINHSTSSNVTVAACDSYTWHGTTYTESPVTYVPTYTTTNAAGCDSVVYLYLTINNSSTSVDMVTACDTYTWHGVTYTASTTNATYTTINAAGCDSVVTLSLLVNHSSATLDVETACDEFTWMNGTTYTASTNTATYVLTNAEGCDSTITLNLTINHSTAYIDNQTACDSYTWIDGVTYTEMPVTYAPTYTTTNAAGCDSVITLNLTMNYSVREVVNVTACDSYEWEGATYTQSGVFEHQYTAANGCDSTAVLNLTVNYTTYSFDTVQGSGSFTWIDGNTYTVGDTTVIFVIANAAGCDSVMSVHIIVIEDKPIPQIVAYNNRVLMVVHNYDSVYVDYDAYQWYRDGEAIEGATEDFFNNDDNSPLKGCYYVMVPIDNQMSSWVMSNILCFGDQGIDDVEAQEVSLTVAPNPVRRGQMVRIETSLDDEQLRGAQLVIYDMRGAKMYEQPMEQSVHMLNVTFPSGTYIVRLRTAQGIETVKKFVVK